MQIKTISRTMTMTPEEVAESNRQQWKGQRLTHTSDHYPKTRAEHAVAREKDAAGRIWLQADRINSRIKEVTENGKYEINPYGRGNWFNPATQSGEPVVFAKPRGKSTRKLERRMMKEAQ